MSSTRNLNTKSDYLCEKKQNKSILNYLTNDFYGRQSKEVHLFNLGSIPTKMYSDHFSNNHIDIESKLRGIQSTNLEKGAFNPKLSAKNFVVMDAFDNNLKQNLYLPNPFIHNTEQRFGFHNV